MTPSTPLLSEAARHLVYPREAIRRSLWPQVRQRLESIGVEFDPWQQGLSTITLGVGDDGRFVASVGGVVVSIPRQVGKTFTVGHLLIGLCLEFPGLRVIWTSHHATTTDNTFQSMQALVLRPEVKPFLAGKPRTANGQQRIVFANGSRIMFGAREHGFGRGMDAIDVLVLDEAQKLSVKALEDMVPATNQARNPHGALVFLTGTPPRPSDDGEAFTTLRKAALAGESPSRIYVEFSADPDASWDDREQWRRMNPSFPHRTPEVSMLRMRELIPGEDSWRREAMGIWDDEAAQHVLDPIAWGLLEGPGQRRPDPVALGVEMSTDRRWAVLGLAGRDERGEWLQVLDSQPGAGWVVDRVVELVGKHKPVSVAVDGTGPAAALVPALERAGVEVRVLSTREVARGCGLLFDGVAEGSLHHAGGALLAKAAAAVTKKKSGDAFTWGEPPGVDVSPLRAVTVALYGLVAAPEKKKRHSGLVVGIR